MDTSNRKKVIIILIVILINVIMIIAASYSVIKSVKNTLELEASGQLASSSEEETTEEDGTETVTTEETGETGEESDDESSGEMEISLSDVLDYIQENGFPSGIPLVLMIVGCIMIIVSIILLIRLRKVNL